MGSVDNELVIKADREFIESVISLHEQGKDVEGIMFSLNLPYEDEIKE